ncbi:MAG: glycosyl transferase family 51 [Desulfobulbus sp.]|nr:MAG: glycosyl transferase family 51 [Desulfobulbus sp.]
MWRFFKIFVVIIFVVGLLAAGAAGGMLYWLVVVEPGEEIDQKNIEKILGRESPVYYRDGQEKIGVLFEEAHRQYATYEQIPRDFVNALVAAEDDQFFSHYGIDLLGIARAMLVNFRAGRVVQGGSTITQQTAKNLFKRQSRTYQAKLKEMLYALRLEYHYSKEKILEFYANQFFVSGNGHGLGVAARYYFDKEVAELSLLECAFIAGSVKRPNYYNPFTKSDEASAERARERAKERTAYVLGKMRARNYISEAAYREAVAGEIGFKRGRMSFALNTVMDMVKDGLAAPEIIDALDEHGISNVSTSGVRVITTVDKVLQGETLHTLRRDLSRLDIMLRGYDRDEVQREYEDVDFRGDLAVTPGSFLFGKIEAIGKDEKGGPLISVDFAGNLPTGFLDEEGLMDVLVAHVKYRKNRWAEAGPKDLPLLLQELRAGDTVYVRVRPGELNGGPALSLERFSELQGAALVMRRGEILAMAGGIENRFYNRAVAALRPMGSTFKPFLFAAALQLGWNTTDLLNNRREVFVFHDRPYFPRPDHLSPHEQVSLSWAGVTSENLAAVWLLYHLTDHLTSPRLQEVAAYLDLAPRTGPDAETNAQFKRRIRDRHGIVVNQDALQLAAYDRAVKNLEPDFLFDDRAVEYEELKQIPYGQHFDRYAGELRAGMEAEEKGLSMREARELETRQGILRRSFLALQPSLNALEQFRLHLASSAEPVGEADSLALLDRESGNLRAQGNFWEDGASRIIFSLHSARQGWRYLSEEELRTRLGSLDHREVEEFWQDVRLEGGLSVFAVKQVNSQMAKENETLQAADPYSMEVLGSIRDYRILVGLQYLIAMAKNAGVTARLEPVLSFPLGSNVISLIDGVRMYEAIVTGMSHAGHLEKPDPDRDEYGGEGVAIIDRIETEEGEIIYAREQSGTRVVDGLAAAAVGHILQNTVKFGTGRFARDTVRLRSTDPDRQKFLAALNLPLPLLGKTGTANDFRNAAFFGYVPVLSDDETAMSLDGGYTVGVYVGFDDNRPMEKGATRIAGSAGALPTWSGIASAILEMEEVGDRADTADLSFGGLPLRYPELGQVFVPVDPERGGAVLPGQMALRTMVAPEQAAILSYGRQNLNGHFEPDRYFRPFWKNGP